MQRARYMTLETIAPLSDNAHRQPARHGRLTYRPRPAGERNEATGSYTTPGDTIPDRIADELGRIAMACIKRVSGRRHPAQISDHPGSAKPEVAQLGVPAVSRFYTVRTPIFG